MKILFIYIKEKKYWIKTNNFEPYYALVALLGANSQIKKFWISFWDIKTSPFNPFCDMTNRRLILNNNFNFRKKILMQTKL